MPQVTIRTAAPPASKSGFRDKNVFHLSCSAGMSCTVNSEVEIAIDPIESPQNSLTSASNSFSTLSTPMPTVHICGLLPKRYHNQLLYAIAHDLMPEFFVSTNPIQSNRWTVENTNAMLRQTEALIFLLNEATVADRRCLLTLQYGWELKIPTILLRQPRVRLIIKPASATAKSTNQPYDPSTPNMPLLQDIIYEAYKTSLEYDRNNHFSGIRRIINRLRQIIGGKPRDATEWAQLHPIAASTAKHVDIYDASVNHLKLPLIPSPPHSLISAPISRLDSTNLPNIMRSRSLGNLSKFGGHNERSTKRSNDVSLWSRRNSHNANNGYGATGSKRSLAPSSATPRLLLSEFDSTDDPTLYHETQYLIFPVKDKSQKPRLIRFPSALTEQEHTEIESIWGSDASLEEEAERAERVAAGIHVHTPPDSPPAPYLAPL